MEHIMDIDINVDIGEGFEFDALLMSKVSSCNVACGGHAGSIKSIDATLQLAKKHKVTVGAHPSLPDTVNFGRIWFEMEESELLKNLISQVHLLKQRASLLGVAVQYIKPHGALYNKAVTDELVALLMVQLCQYFKLALMGLSNSMMEKMAKKHMVPFIKESFADRRYHQDGTLVSRTQPNAVIDHPLQVWDQLQQLLLKKEIVTVEGANIPLETDSICFHGDHLASVQLLSYVVNQFQMNGIIVKSKL